jgi:LysR family transcriptional regulator, cyn operon transcriptional activator
MRWSLRQLEVFLAVLEEGGFSAAGERVGMVQPAVSIAIRKLEEKSGVRLLERSGHRVRPTKEGAVCLGHARMIRSQIASLERQLKEMRSLDTGHVSIGAPPLISAFLLPEIARKFLSRHRGIKLSVVEDSSTAIADRVRSGELDLGIIAGHQDMDGLEAALIEQHPVVACVPARSALARLSRVGWKQLLEQPLVLFAKGYNQRSLVDDMAATLGHTLNIVVEAESGRFITAMVRAGHGVSVTFAIIAEEATGVVGVPITEAPTIPIFSARRKGGVPSIAANAFLEATAAHGAGARR